MRSLESILVSPLETATLDRVAVPVYPAGERIESEALASCG
jgi:hypothetical protein